MPKTKKDKNIYKVKNLCFYIQKLSVVCAQALSMNADDVFTTVFTTVSPTVFPTVFSVVKTVREHDRVLLL